MLTDALPQAQIQRTLGVVEERFRSMEAVCAEQARLGEFFASIDDDVRAAAHLSCAARLRAALGGRRHAD